MFGYVKPLVSELKVAEYERYRALYCGMCLALGRITGEASRFTLSYDSVFLAAVRMTLAGTEPELYAHRCAVHPLNKRPAARPCDELYYSAAASALLVYEKNRDDLADERGMKRLRAAVLSPFSGVLYRRAAKLLPDSCAERVREGIARLSRLEREGCTSVNETAQCFGDVLGVVFSAGLCGERAELAYEIGCHTGRFVYVCDAADDMEEDLRRGRYNPLSALWGEYAADENGRMTPMVKSSVRDACPIELERLGDAVERLGNTECAAHLMLPIIKNTVYLGMPAAMERVLDGSGKKPKMSGDKI